MLCNLEILPGVTGKRITGRGDCEESVRGCCGNCKQLGSEREGCELKLRQRLGEERANNEEAGRKLQQSLSASWLKKVRERERAKGDTEILNLGSLGGKMAP